MRKKREKPPIILMLLSSILLSLFIVWSLSSIKSYAYNKSLFDTKYDFNKAIIDLHNEVIIVDVKEWTDFEDGEQLQIIAKDGTVYLTSSFNCTLIKTK